MRCIARLAVAFVLSAAAVAALTWAGWPRPRFVVPMPAMAPGSRFDREDWRWFDRLSDHPPPAHRSPWLGFRVLNGDTAAPRRQAFWFVNLDDGRAAGPWEIPTVNAFAWDHRGAAVVRGVVPADAPGLQSIGRFDPETMTYARIAGDRGDAFLVSANGTTLVTSSPGEGHWFLWPPTANPGGQDFVCYDLAADPPRSARAALVVPRPGRSHDHPRDSVRDAFGGVAVSPDGSTLAVSDLIRGDAVPWGVTLLDTRTGAVLRRITDLGPRPSSPDSGPEDLQFVNDGRHLKFVWTSQPRVWYSSSALLSNTPNHEADGRLWVLDLDKGGVLPVGSYRDLQLVPHTPDGALRVETRPSLRGLAAQSIDAPASMRVVDTAGTPLAPWRATTEREGGAIVCGLTTLVPGTTGCVVVLPGFMRPPHPWATWYRKRLGLAPPPPASPVAWIDWANDRRQVFTELQTDGSMFAMMAQIYVAPGRLAIVRHDHAAGIGTVEVWDAPPPRPPWAWSVPGGVAAGVLLTALGTRLLRRRTRGPIPEPAGGVDAKMPAPA